MEEADKIFQLPLSFLASFFALDVQQFPKDASGSISWQLGHVSGYLCKHPDSVFLLFFVSDTHEPTVGLSIAASTPFIILAFSVNPGSLALLKNTFKGRHSRVEASSEASGESTSPRSTPKSRVPSSAPSPLYNEKFPAARLRSAWSGLRRRNRALDEEAQASDDDVSSTRG